MISGNTGDGVEVTGAGATANLIMGNYIGTSADGTAAIANNAGVEIDSGAEDNLIGSLGDGVAADAGERNVVSGNTYAGVWITGTNTNGNFVSGNYIGTNAAGTAAVGNGSVPDSNGLGGGIVIENGASNNLVGTDGQSFDDAGERNIISGNLDDGVDIFGSATAGNVVAGNYIGTNAAGTAAIGNTSVGVRLDSLTVTNWVGVNPVYFSEDADEANVISGNGFGGVYFLLTTGSVAAGNLIGTDASGSSAIPNFAGVWIELSSSNLVGTTGQDGADDALERNVISGNSNSGVIIEGGVPSSMQNVIAGDYIGTNAAGTGALANHSDGISIDSGAADNWVGVNSVYGPENADQGNVISGNTGDGVEIYVASSTGNTVAGNDIGTDHTGTAAIPNYAGVEIDFGASGNTDRHQRRRLERRARAQRRQRQPVRGRVDHRNGDR